MAAAPAREASSTSNAPFARGPGTTFASAGWVIPSGQAVGPPVEFPDVHELFEMDDAETELGCTGLRVGTRLVGDVALDHGHPPEHLITHVRRQVAQQLGLIDLGQGHLLSCLLGMGGVVPVSLGIPTVRRGRGGGAPADARRQIAAGARSFGYGSFSPAGRRRDYASGP